MSLTKCWASAILCDHGLRRTICHPPPPLSVPSTTVPAAHGADAALSALLVPAWSQPTKLHLSRPSASSHLSLSEISCDIVITV